LAVDACGAVCSWGSNEHHQLGRCEGQNESPGLVDLPKIETEGEPVENWPTIEISSVDCGGHHCAALAIGGQVLTWGMGENGQLGHRERRSCETVTEVTSLAGKYIRAISCGFAHTVALEAYTGKLWAWGLNQHGQLGSSAHYFDHATPQLVDVVSGAKIESVSCGWGATVAVDSERQRVWTWGYFRDSEGHKVGEATSVIIRAGSQVLQAECGASEWSH